MFYGSGDFLGCHWEIIIKAFRRHYSRIKFSTLSECRAEFQKFINDPSWWDAEAAQLNAAHMIAKCIFSINEDVDAEGAMQFRKQIQDLANESKAPLINRENTNPQATLKKFKEDHLEEVKRFAEEIFERKVPKKSAEVIASYIFEFFRRAGNPSDYETGAVFFGYGEDQKYPAIEEFVVDGLIDGKPRLWPERELNLNDGETKGAIIPFAQIDVASLFMEGVSPIYVRFFFAAIEGLIEKKDDYFIANFVPKAERVVEKALRNKENEDLIEELGRAFRAVRQMEVINPMIESIHALPRDEMAAMAEAFVELTSMRRKVDSHLDSVGGPVDVALITKGEGFVWIKRKMYFKGDMNPDFMERRKRLLRAASSEESDG